MPRDRVEPPEPLGSAGSATIEDVAAAAQVSVATVSRALRGLPNVAPSTRERVLGAATALDYIADASASRLASGATRTVGLVVPMLGQWYYGTAVGGAEGVLVAADYDLLPLSTAGPGGLRRFLATMPFRKRVDGLIVIDAALSPEQLHAIAAVTEHVVTIGHAAPDVTSIHVENRHAARRAVDHLIGLGHRRIAMIGGMDDDPFQFRVPVDRYAGYRDALVGAELAVEPALTIGGNFSMEGGAEAMHALLELPEPPSAVFALSDEMAIGAMQVARDAGLRIPEDLSIVGFDDHDVSAYVGLTTIRQDVTRLGERAAELLLARIRDPQRQAVHEVAPTRLLVRRTTAPPRTGRP